MEEQYESWRLHSGTWLRDRVSETWRLAATRDGTAVDPKLPALDLAHLIGAGREPATGEWFPPEFTYSQNTGARLRPSIRPLSCPWVPPFGAYAPPGAKPHARGLKQTPVSLTLARPHERSASGDPDRTLPPLPGQYRFVVDNFAAACPTLIAVEPELGTLLVLLPESKSWAPLARSAGASWGQRLRNGRGWRMELVDGEAGATAYCPSATGLAAITPNAIGLCYAVEHAGEAPAIGGPVEWQGEIWLPVLGKGQLVHLVDKPHGSARHTVLQTRVPAPQHGFEAPVFDDLHVNWPCDEGQLVLRLDDQGGNQCDWIAWPDKVKPVFGMGCVYVPNTGTFWQVCRIDVDGRFQYVQMAKPAPEAVPVDGPRMCLGRACYRGTMRIDVDPPRTDETASTEVVTPLLESARDGAVVGLRMDAPQGALALLQAGDEARRAVLQVEVRGRPAIAFGALDVKAPWLAQLFVYDAHLWLHHPELPQAVGWQLAPPEQ